MIVYSTPFNSVTRDCTGLSVDSGFTSMNQVIEMMGEPDKRDSNTLLIYGTDVNRVLFSHVEFKK